VPTSSPSTPTGAVEKGYARYVARADGSEAWSTLWAAVPSWSLMYVNFLSVIGLVDWQNTQSRLRWIRVFTVVLPIIWGAAYLFIQSPVLMVQIGGVMTGIFLLGAVAAVWYLRRTETDPRLYGGGAFNAVLVVSSIAIVLLGV
jgi:hypothetical protein